MKAALILFSLLGVACICSAQVVYLQSYNYLDKRIRHQNFRGKITELVNDVDNNDGGWKIVPGLADSGLISFESANFPGHYLRHKNLEIWLEKFNETTYTKTDPTFKNDSTFKIVPGIANKDWISFEAYTHKGFHIRHAGFQLFIHKSDGSQLYNMDVTFRKTASLSSQVSTFIQPFNHDNHRLRHQDFRAKLHELSSDLDKKDGSWRMVPGLWNASYVSFESVNFPNHYLRDTKNSELRLEKADTSDDYRKAATFKIVPGFADEDALSFESVAKPGYYIHHWGWVFNVRKPKESTDAMMEQYFGLCATFRKTNLMKEDDAAVAFLADV